MTARRGSGWAARPGGRRAGARLPRGHRPEALRESRPLRVADLAGRVGQLPAGSWPEPPAEAMVLPMYAAAEPIGVLALAASAARRLDGDYQTFLGLVARQTASLINGASAYRAQQRRAEEL